jgi:hypothetical protein
LAKPAVEQQPENVELLFHRQRPGVPQVPGSVAVVIGGVDHRVPDVTRPKRQGTNSFHQHDDRDVQVIRRENTQSPAKVEATETDRANPTFLFQQSDVIKNPEMTKKTRTPSGPRKKMPSTREMTSGGWKFRVPSRWAISTSEMENARRPSRPRILDPGLDEVA